jgi:hypothetical protein
VLLDDDEPDDEEPDDELEGEDEPGDESDEDDGAVVLLSELPLLLLAAGALPVEEPRLSVR